MGFLLLQELRAGLFIFGGADVFRAVLVSVLGADVVIPKGGGDLERRARVSEGKAGCVLGEEGGGAQILLDFGTITKNHTHT